MSNISSILLEKQNSRTAAIGEELDEPGVEADAVGGSEPDVLVGEAEAGRGEGVGLGEARHHGHVHQPLLEGHQQRHARHRDAPHPVQQRVHVGHHFRASLLPLSRTERAGSAAAGARSDGGACGGGAMPGAGGRRRRRRLKLETFCYLKGNLLEFSQESNP